MSVDTSHMKVRCPACRQWKPWRDNPFRPFCSGQCKKGDLGNWATGRYRIPVVDEEVGEETPEVKKRNDSED